MTDKPTYEELEKRIQKLEQVEFERKRAVEALPGYQKKLFQFLKRLVPLSPKRPVTFKLKGILITYPETQVDSPRIGNCPHPVR